ncbi:GNAT family N-acetyltransferase [Spirillospora sp. NBC_01491]|uniref:GNAT family N-acetyltransferase n=1 Tax=Spirillospora sp. NBC_01491 TaxID=2976007 RepID=UPI002E36001C|nr:GNAT family N-acetyltransferase [Spirillospora sp. NBC_01491]
MTDRELPQLGDLSGPSMPNGSSGSGGLAAPGGLDGLDGLVAAAWPAPYVQDIGGWLLRHADGVTKRANSVLPLEAPEALDEAIARAEGFYTERGLPTVFSMSGQSRPSGLDALLHARGYELVDPTLAMTTEITGPYREDGAAGVAGVVVEDAPSREWLERWWAVDGRYAEQLPVAEKILTGVPAGYASLDGAAVGRAVPQGEWLGIYAMAVAPDARRRGLGRRVLGGLLDWGGTRGCTRAYLVVIARNAAARALYESEGFGVSGGYHYRIKPLPAR